MTDEPANEPEPTTELWLFAGARVSGNDPPFHCWIDNAGNDGEELHYVAKGSYTVGSLYEVKVVRSGERTTRYGTPLYHGRHDNEALRAELEAKNRATRAIVEKRRMERNDAKASAFDNAMRPLLAIAKTMRTIDQKDAFTAAILRKVHDQW